MSSVYAPRQTTAQKKNAPTASSVLDNSPQSEGLQRKADTMNLSNVTCNIIQKRDKYTPPDRRYPHLHEYSGGSCYSQGKKDHIYLRDGDILYQNNITYVRDLLARETQPRFVQIRTRFIKLFGE